MRHLAEANRIYRIYDGFGIGFASSKPGNSWRGFSCGLMDRISVTAAHLFIQLFQCVLVAAKLFQRLHPIPFRLFGPLRHPFGKITIAGVSAQHLQELPAEIDDKARMASLDPLPLKLGAPHFGKLWFAVVKMSHEPHGDIYVL